MLRTMLLVIGVILIALGGFLVHSALFGGDRVPQDLPKPRDGAPAWAHVCMGANNDSKWCEGI